MAELKVNGENVKLKLTPYGMMEVEKECEYNVTELVSNPEKAMAGAVSFDDVLKTLYAGYKGANNPKISYKAFCESIDFDLGGIYDSFFDLLFPGVLEKISEELKKEELEVN